MRRVRAGGCLRCTSRAARLRTLCTFYCARRRCCTTSLITRHRRVISADPPGYAAIRPSHGRVTPIVAVKDQASLSCIPIPSVMFRLPPNREAIKLIVFDAKIEPAYASSDIFKRAATIPWRHDARRLQRLWIVSVRCVILFKLPDS